jgi:Protein of unknown function (DUF2510)/Domain of unknown function (DUF4352)
MTTPPTPAGWYPDPEGAGHLRYWDGAAWTEHFSPNQEPPAPPAPVPPAAPSAPEPPAEPSFAASSGAHRAPDSEPEPTPPGEPDPLSLTEQPTTEVPLRQWSFEPPPLEPESTPGWITEQTPAREPTSTPEPPPEPPSAAPPLPLTDEPTTKVPLRDWSDPTPESAPYADATTPTPPEPPVVEPPAGTEPSTPVDNRKLIMGFGGAVAALLLVLVLAAVYAFVIHKPDTVDASSPASGTPTSTTEETTTSEDSTASLTPLPPPPAGSATDGPLTFTVVGVETGPTITDTENEFLTKDAQGEYIVVRLTVQNTSPDPGQFLGTFQKLNAAGQQFTVDDQATFFVGGGFVDIAPGAEAAVGLAYDVPPGTVPESVELHADPVSPGVVLPLG